jgi:hypothetical protein
LFERREVVTGNRLKEPIPPCFPQDLQDVVSNPKIKNMKIVHKTKTGETREALLKEYFINASLIALLKRVGEEAAKVAPARAKKAALARVKY